MPRHLTIRLAWHDNKWNGAICSDPAANVYCAGTHSLLSERMAREKNIVVEMQNRNRKLDQVPKYLPPCFWSSNAFSSQPADVVHVHPLHEVKHQGKVVAKLNKPLRERLQAYSVFSWPFRLSFNHSLERRKKEGSYPADLEDRIERFRRKFKPGESFVFFYLNYSNPVSANDYRYALVGCALLKSISEPTYWRITDAELTRIRRVPRMQNFTKMNWALQFSYDVKKNGIILPYQEYVRHIAEHPEEEEGKMLEMRALIEEDSLIPRFKYVAEELNDDQCIYLLYKLRKAIKIVQKHGIVNFDREEVVIERLLETAWKNRGLYPSLGRIVELLADQDSPEQGQGDELVSTIREHLSDSENLLEAVFELLRNSGRVPKYLASFSELVEAARKGLRTHSSLEGLLRKLSLFSLTKFQIQRIVFPDSQEKGEHPFGGKKIKPDDLVANPYLLCENYVPTDRNLDEPEHLDGLIDIFMIDFGMFPDKHFVKERDDKLQDLHPAGPERLRALIIEYLRSIESEGHCFDSLDNVYEYIQQHPLFYKQRLPLNREELVKGMHRKHLSERLEIVESDGQHYFYLREVREAEQLIAKVVTNLISRKTEHNIDLRWVNDYLDKESEILRKRIKGFPEKQFKDERRRLLEGSLRRSFYVITGKPGSGKTQVLKKVIEVLKSRNENIILLAPTGKATLRLKRETGFQEAETIDMFLYRNWYGHYLENFENFAELRRNSKTPPIENLIIDECSMVDLKRLAVLFALLDLKGANAVKRVILVGDENQLPPIGYGRPFFDIVEFLKSKGYDRHLIRLETNCRQEFDANILRVADIFVGKNRYYEELLEKLKTGGQISEGLVVEHWTSPEELQAKIRERLNEVINREVGSQALGNLSGGFNQLLGLYPEGYVPENSPQKLDLDRFQIITPYNTDFYGTLGLNQFIRSEYKKGFFPDSKYPNKLFGHSEKVIRMVNWYQWSRKDKKRDLVLSNGSIGVVCNTREGRAWFFPERKFRDIVDEENFELAYAITVHKAQGSEFKNVFVVVPEKRGLLSNELLYTALTRSTHRVVVFLQRTERESPIEVARRRTFVLARNTSLFTRPEEAWTILEPERGVQVKSRIEYIIYRALMEERAKGRLNFKYEHELPLRNKPYPIHPDFTIFVDGRTYYWEHLGELDQREYYESWKERRDDYERNGYGDILITTDDLGGIKQELVQRIIHDMINGVLHATPESPFSKHHYKLYES